MAVTTKGVFLRLSVVLVAGCGAWLMLGHGNADLPGLASPSANGRSVSSAEAVQSEVVVSEAAAQGNPIVRQQVAKSDGILFLKFRRAGGGVPGVDVNLYSEAEGSLSGAVISDESGIASFSSLRAGGYRLLVAGPWLLPGGKTSLPINLEEGGGTRIVEVEEGYVARYKFVNGNVIFHKRQPVDGFQDVVLTGVGRPQPDGVISACFRRDTHAGPQEPASIKVIAESAGHGRCEFDVPLVSAERDSSGYTVCDFAGRPEVDSVELIFEVVDGGGQRVDVDSIILSERREGESVPHSLAGASSGKPINVPLDRVFNQIEVGNFPISWRFKGLSVDTSDAVDGVLRVPLKLPCKLIPVDFVIHPRVKSEGKLYHVAVEAPAEWGQWKGVRVRGGMKQVIPGKVYQAWFPQGGVVLKVFRGTVSWDRKIDVSPNMEIVSITV